MISTNILVLDPSVLSGNTGDEIIQDSVYRELHDLFPEFKLIKGYTQDYPGPVLISNAKRSRFSVLAGTNLLSGNLADYKQWKIGWRHVGKYPNLLLMGVGWWQYQNKTTARTALLYKQLLCSNAPHSVRDSYTQSKLASIGVMNVFNTGCPTTWRLGEVQKPIPMRRGRHVVVTLTDYNKSPKEDKAMLQLCTELYDKVFLWPQGSGDLEYVRSLNPISCFYLGNSLRAYDQFLASQDDLDYVGTRLHAGIRALQFGKKTLIIGIDNRALEMGKDIGLPVCERRDLQDMHQKLLADSNFSLRIPIDEISKWRSKLIDYANRL
jgi:polysaccharide pyruvyl transferase WcaK-like protein